jgi:hypothetical protein
MSKRYLADFVEREVNREKPAHDVILGITFTGTSQTTGNTKLRLRPNESHAAADIVFEGKIQSQTVGHKGPATLHYRSDSTFTARKPIVFDQDGLHSSPAEADAPTRLTPTAISTNLPGLRGGIAQRIAWSRAAQSQAAADRIASEHRSRDIREGLDQRLEEKLSEYQAVIKSEIANLKLEDDAKLAINSRSTPDYIELALASRDNNEKFKMPTFDVTGNPDLAVRVHRSVVGSLLANSQLQSRLAPLATSFLQLGEAQDQRDSRATNMAVDGDWIVVNVNGEKSAEPPRVAADSSEMRIR